MKWLAWLIKTVLATAMICLVSTYITFTLVQMYMTQLLEPLFPQVANQQVAITDLVAQISTPLHINKKGDVLPNQESEHNPHKPDSDQVNRDPQLTRPEQQKVQANRKDDEQEASNSGEEQNQNDHPQDAVAVWQSMSFSEADILRVKNELTNEEKMKIFSILLSNVPQQEIQALSEVLEGGINEDEIEMIDSVMRAYLDDEDYQQFIDIFLRIEEVDE